MPSILLLKNNLYKINIRNIVDDTYDKEYDLAVDCIFRKNCCHNDVEVIIIFIRIEDKIKINDVKIFDMDYQKNIQFSIEKDNNDH